ncbi:hypothetical protein [Streptomyces tendae]|uniref:hypothetical protein n=1 Tax=Streptomyces tendae TaxID=1932 RepID=UPI003662A526
METLSFWMTVVGTVAGVVSMWIAVLERRGPRQPKEGPSKLRGFFLMAYLYFLLAVCVVPIVINIGSAWSRFDMDLSDAALAALLNGCALYVFNVLVSASRGVRVAYNVFCATFVVLYAVIGIAVWQS